MVTMKVVGLIVMKHHRNDPWGVYMCILKMTIVSMITMKVKNILFDLIVMKLHKNNPWRV
jgi:hypothetical protein